jgi:hypothetical protein
MESSCEKCPLGGRSTQLTLPIAAYGLGVADWVCQQLGDEDIQQSTGWETGGVRGYQVGIARQTKGLFGLDVKFGRNIYRARGWRFRRSSKHSWLPLRSSRYSWLIGRNSGLGVILGGASGKELSSFCFKFSTSSRGTALEECGDGFESNHYVGWFRVICGRAACTLVHVYMVIRLRESVSLGQ